MPKKTTPKVRRTRRHVVVRLSPLEAKAAAFLVCGMTRDQLPPLIRGGAASRAITALKAANELGATDLPAAPKSTSISRATINIE